MLSLTMWSACASRRCCRRLFRAQSFWVAVALLALMLAMTVMEPTFGSAENLGNISRNFAPIGIMALGMTVVLITGGIDLSVGSIMALVAIVAGLFLTWHYPWYVAFSMGMLTGLACGVFNGFFVAYVRHAVLRGDARDDVDSPGRWRWSFPATRCSISSGRTLQS